MSFNGRQRPRYSTLAQSQPEQHLDGWENFLTNVGVHGKDKRLSTRLKPAPIFNQRAELDELFHGNDLAQRICTLVAVEMTRQWVCLKIEGEDEGASDVDLVKSVMQRCDELRIQSKLAEGITWARLYGGGVIYMGIDDGLAQDLPVNMDNIRSLPFLTVMDRHELRIVKRFADPLALDYGKPELYEIVTVGDPQGIAATQAVSRFGQRIHATRLLHFDGAPTTRLRRRQINNGWADSIFCRLFEVIRGYDNTWSSAEALMQDFSQAVIKIKGLAEMMASHGEAQVRARMETLDASRSILRAVMLDAEFEDFERKPTPMTGLPDLLDRWLHRVSAAAEVPVTLLFGMSPGGLNATADGDIEFFYNTIKTKQEQELRPELEKFFKVLFRTKDGPTKGIEPSNWSFNFEPLWQMSDKEKSEVRKAQADTDAIYLDRGVLSPDEVASSRFGGDEYSMETTINDEARATLADVEAKQQAEADAKAQAMADATQAAGG